VLSIGVVLASAGPCKSAPPDPSTAPASAAVAFTPPASTSSTIIPFQRPDADGAQSEPRGLRYLRDTGDGQRPQARILCSHHQGDDVWYDWQWDGARTAECWFRGVVRALHETVVARDRAVRVVLDGTPGDGCSFVPNRGELAREFLLSLPPGIDLPFSEGEVICGSHGSSPITRFYTPSFYHDVLIARPNGDLLIAHSDQMTRASPPIPGWKFTLGAQRTFLPSGGESPNINLFDLLVAHAGVLLRLPSGEGHRAHAGTLLRLPPGEGYRMLRAPDGVFVARGSGGRAGGAMNDEYAFEIIRIARPSPTPGPPPNPSPSPTASPPDEVPLLGPQGAPLLAQPPDVRLACRIDQGSDHLHIRFDITNASKEPIHAFDHGGRQNADFDILCDAGGGVVHALLGVPPLPPFPIYWRYQPKGTTIDPGTSVHRDMRAEVPLRERNAYWPLEYQVDSGVETTRLTLRVDFLRASKIKDNRYPDEPRGDVEAVSCSITLPNPIELRRRDNKQLNAEGTQNMFPFGRM
jgi:hypothetical protein